MLANKQRSDQPRRPEQLAASNLHHGFCVASGLRSACHAVRCGDLDAISISCQLMQAPPQRCANSTSAHARLRKLRPHVRATLAAACIGEVGFDVGQPDMIRPAVSVGLDVVAAAVIAAIDQHVADAGGAQLAEGDLLGVGGHGWRLVLARFDP